MYLLIQRFIYALCIPLIFTFHNVSINSILAAYTKAKKKKFTFHNVSINSDELNQEIRKEIDLHSIMYLLILSYLRNYYKKIIHLHSIMYLLIPR